MSKPTRLAVTALTGSVMAGKANAKGDGLLNRQDVTSDFMKAVIDKADFHGGSFIIRGDGKQWEVTVKQLEKTEAQQDDISGTPDK